MPIKPDGRRAGKAESTALTDPMARILDLAQAGLDDPGLSADDLWAESRRPRRPGLLVAVHYDLPDPRPRIDAAAR